MSKWSKISLRVFQTIDRIQQIPGLDETDRTLYAICEVFDKTQYEVNTMPLGRVEKLARRVESIFSSEPPTIASPRIGRYRMNYDVSSMTFGQYVELSFFFNQHIYNAHYALASASRPLFRSYDTDGHPKRAEYFLNRSVQETIGALAALMRSYADFNKGYPSLFGTADESQSIGAPGDRFTRRYGWTYSASAIAEYERISLQQVYAMPVREAFNDLAYLKEKVAFEMRERDRLINEYKLKQNG